MARTYGTPRFPTDPSELGAAMADRRRFLELFPESDDRSWNAFSTAYAANSPHIAEQTQLGIQQAMQEVGMSPATHVGALPVGGPAGVKRAWRKPPGVAVDSVAASWDRPWTRFLAAANRANDLPQASADRDAIYNASMSERVPSGGGFLVPEQLRSEILALVLEQSVVRPRARVVPMDSLRVPMPTIDDTSHENSVYGGISAYWTAEGATLSATAPKWGRLDLEARKLTAYTSIPNELLQDSVTPLDEWFTAFFPRAVAWFEDVAFISGTGVGEPEGFLNSPAAVKVSSVTPNVIALADVIACLVRLYPPLWTSPGVTWMCSPDALGQLMQMTMTGGTGPNAVSPPSYLSGYQAIAAPPTKLFGFPLVVSEKMPSVSGSVAGALTLVDLGSYLLGDRQSLQLATSDEYLFASDLVAYRAIERLDGRIWNQTPLTPANGGDTLSPVVMLDTTGT